MINAYTYMYPERPGCPNPEISLTWTRWVAVCGIPTVVEMSPASLLAVATCTFFESRKEVEITSVTFLGGWWGKTQKR